MPSRIGLRRLNRLKESHPIEPARCDRGDGVGVDEEAENRVNLMIAHQPTQIAHDSRELPTRESHPAPSR
jgi:hypothetical protein